MKNFCYKTELKRLKNIRDLKREQHFGEEVISRVEELQKYCWRNA